MVPDERKPDAQVIVVTSHPSADDERGQRFDGWRGGGERWSSVQPAPLIGKSGHELRAAYMPLADLGADDTECRSVLRCRWGHAKGLPPLGANLVRDAIRHCQRAYWAPPTPQQRIIALGPYALWATTGEFGAEGADDDDDARANRGIEGWRGWVLPYKPVQGETVTAEVFATHPPDFFHAAHWLKPVGKMDWHRIGQWLRGKWPEPFPTIERDMPSAGWPQEVAFDTEYYPNNGQLIRASIAYRGSGPYDMPQVFVVEATDFRMVRPGPHTAIQHNAEADWPYLNAVFGTIPVGWEDTMYAHSALYGTWRHTLDFLGSLYARTNRWKQLEQSDEILYSGLDALGTWDVWQALSRELARDPESDRVYREEMKPLLKHLMRRVSIRVATDRVSTAVRHFEKLQQEAIYKAEAAAGWPINPASADQLARWIGVKGV
jgi:hypothetical protein